MRKILVLIAAASTLALFVPPAQAAGEQQTYCHTYTNAGGAKKVKVCAADVVNNNGTIVWWGRIDFDNVTGYDMPYAATSIVRFWSKPNGTGSWCEGKAPGCNGIGDGGGLHENMANHEEDNTDHYSSSEHYCVMHTYVSFLIYWTQAHYGSGNYDVSDAFNSSDGTNGQNDNAGPNCIS